MIRPIFPFYGSKWRDARRYPAPHNGVVVEPFAGSAGYALWHEPSQVFLYDVDPIVVGVWQYLIQATVEEVMALPDLEPGQSVDDFDLPQEARWLIGFWLNRGSAQPKKTQTKFSTRTDRQQLVWSQRARERIAGEIPKIRHWKVEQRDYREIPAIEATYFVDPPYVDKGRYYRFKDVDYAEIASWVKLPPGQVIVCEQVGATWLPFRPLASIKSTKGRSNEAIYVRGVDDAPTGFLTGVDPSVLSTVEG